MKSKRNTLSKLVLLTTIFALVFSSMGIALAGTHTTAYYKVSGEDPLEVANAMAQIAQANGWPGYGHVSLQPPPSYGGEIIYDPPPKEDPPGTWTATARIKPCTWGANVDTTTTLPQWDPMPEDEDYAEEWNRFMDALKKHENGHVEKYKSVEEKLKNMKAQMESLTGQGTGPDMATACNNAKKDLESKIGKLVDQVFEAADKLNEMYDQKTDGGREQGADIYGEKEGDFSDLIDKIKKEVLDTQVKLVGNTTGGTLEIPGKAMVEIPPLAGLEESTAYRLTENICWPDANVGLGFASPVYLIGPNDAAFTWPVMLTIYCNEGVDPLSEGLDIYRYNNVSDAWEPMGATLDMTVNSLTVELTHFSEYAVMRSSVTPFPNNPPEADANGPYEIDVEEPLELDGTGSYDPEAPLDYIVEYEWDLDMDGDSDVSGETVSVPTEHFDPGSDPFDGIIYCCDVPFTTGQPTPVSLTVTDTFGATHTDMTTVTIYDNRPVASFTASPNPASPYAPVSFDASSSYHGRADRSIVSYDWDFDSDGIIDANGATVAHTYPYFGTYTATLTVTDDNIPPKTDTATVVIEVNQGNNPPEADANGPYVVDEGQDLVLDASESVDPDQACGDEIVEYRWDLNEDGIHDVTFDTPVGVVPWPQLKSLGLSELGPLGVFLNVVDTFGATGDDNTTLTINNLPPVCDLDGPYYCDEGESVTVVGTVTDPGDNSADIEIDWGDGWVESFFDVVMGPIEKTHTYEDDGSYTVTMTAEDDDGGTTVCETTVTVINVAPEVDAGEDQEVNEGKNANISVVFFDPGADQFDIEIDWGDGYIESFFDVVSPVPGTHAYGDNGVYDVTVRVTDDDGGVGQDILQVTVNNVAPTITGYLVTSPNPEFILPGDEVTVIAVFTDPGWLDTHTARIDWGDGTPESFFDVFVGPFAATHVYSEPGAYTITLTVEDDDGGSDVIATEVTVVPADGACDLIDDYIQDLPDDAFKNNPDQRQNALSNKLAEVNSLIELSQYEEAINKLLNDIRARVDGSLGGNPKNDWITDPEAQQAICTMIDELIAFLETLI